VISRSKSEEMFFAASLKEAKMQTELSEDLMLHDSSRIHFTNSFKYLGLIITLLLNKDSKIEVRIKSKIFKGMHKIFFHQQRCGCHLKYQVYTSGPLYALLWGCETWNLIEKTLVVSEASTMA
jgi:stress-induced morphogen